MVLAGCHPAVADWAGIDGREQALGIGGGVPILIDPGSRVDPRLALFFRRSL